MIASKSDGKGVITLLPYVAHGFYSEKGITLKKKLETEKWLTGKWKGIHGSVRTVGVNGVIVHHIHV